MAFNSFANRLPDPNYKITEAGENSSGGLAGPGFKTVKFESQQPTSFTRTNSGRVITRAIVGHNWKINITYNPMTRDQFEPVYSFLLEKRGRLKPFFVALPQYSSSRTATSGTISVDGAATAGATNIKVDGFGSVTGGLRPGDMFTITDSSNSNHKKIYQITRVADTTNRLTTDTIASDERRYYITPPLEKDVSNDSTLVYSEPLVRVVQTADIQEYSLGTNNLYSFALNLEEAQP
jgi:hypothetical protein|tara:strand:+ start:630 stop:1337 length:708 start_codon:yes stop_codon:yes gene_type:complete